jgi:LacI family transcriptional regulator
LYKPDHLAALVNEWRPDAIILTFNAFDRVVLPDVGAFVAGVACDLSSRGITSIDIDDEAVGRIAATHLLEHSFPNLAAFGYWNTPWAITRAVHFAQEVERHGRSATLFCTAAGQMPAFDLETNPTRDDVKSFLCNLPKPVGIFAGCDSWAVALICQARLLGFRVPEDIAVLGVDNDEPLCETCCPPLSSIVIPWSEMGRQAAEYVLQHIAGHATPRFTRMAPLGVVTRRSTDVYAVSDPMISSVLNLIHAHAGRPLSVADILRQIPVCQHTLERRFKALIGRRILDEVRRVHVEQAKRLLIGTSLPMTEVARLSGFANAAKLSAAFHRETGHTPTAYRSEFRLRHAAGPEKVSKYK